MRLIDSNLLLYAHDPASEFHEAARQWLEAALSSGERYGIPMICIASFLRIATDRRLKRLSLRMSDAILAVESWIAVETVSVIHTGDAHWGLLLRCIQGGAITGAMVADAQLAALTMESHSLLLTTDRDFSRFPELRWQNPLAPARKRR